MLKSVTYEKTIFKFLDGSEKILPNSYYNDEDFEKVSLFLEEILQPRDLPYSYIGNIESYVKTNGKTKLTAFTDINTDIIYFNDNNSCAIYSKKSFLGKLIHESVHTMHSKIVFNNSDTYLATAIGRWFEYKTFGNSFLMGDNVKYIGMGTTSVQNKLLKPAISKIHNKILTSKPINRALTEKKHGYILGNIIFEIMQEAETNGIRIEQIYQFIRDLSLGKPIRESFSTLLINPTEK